MKNVLAGMLVAALLIGGKTTQAHHSFAAVFDSAKPVKVSGKVTNMEWVNPHARFYVDVKNASGGVDKWECELVSPNSLMRIGWTRKSLVAGDEITVEGFAARDGTHRLDTHTVTLADGSKVSSGERVAPH